MLPKYVQNDSKSVISAVSKLVIHENPPTVPKATEWCFKPFICFYGYIDKY